MTDTPYGPIRFVDGVQSWVNPEVGGPGPHSAAPTGRDAEIARLKGRVGALKQKLSALKAECDALRMSNRTGGAARD